MIKPTGTSTMTAATAKSNARSPPSRLWKYHASIIGRPSFMISEGWMRPMPMSSQRVAPFTVTPFSSVATSSATPTTYTGTASRISNCGDTLAAMNSTANAIAKLRAWSVTRHGKSLPAEYSVTSPITARLPTTASSAGSNTLT